MLRLLVAALTAMALASPSRAETPPVRLYAAGSLRAVMGEIADAFEAGSGIAVESTFGASGLLRDRIAKGESAEVFASANMAHPESLAKAGHAGPVAAFALNRLCALVGPKVSVTTETLLDRMLDPAIKLGTSTPKADLSGDYAWEVQARREMPALAIVAMPEALAVGAEYGLVVMQGVRPEAQRFASFIRSPAARAILERHGFGLPTAN